MAIFMGARSLLFIVLISTFMYVASETNRRCRPNRRCFVEKIEKSSDTKKNPDQLKFAALRSVLLKLHDIIIQERQPGEMILQNKIDVTMTCQNGNTTEKGWTGETCDFCAEGWSGGNCTYCDVNFGPPGQCDTCVLGWSGDNCDSCATHFGPPERCDQCLRGWTGENCSECAVNFGPEGQCDQCLRGWTGENCSECAVNFGPAGQCDTCLTGWTGDICDACVPGWTGDDCDTCADGWFPPTCDQICDGFGCCNHDNCQGCIQNGRWEGSVGAESLEVHLTFRGDTCTQVVPGTAVTRSNVNYNIQHGSVDDTNNILRFTHNNRPEYQANIASDKSFSGIQTLLSFSLNYRPPERK